MWIEPVHTYLGGTTILANISGKFEQYMVCSYREINRTELFVYMFSHIPDIEL